MQVLNSLAIVVAGALVAAAILYTERFQIWQDGAAIYVHDTWRGDLTGCAMTGTPPQGTISCAPVAPKAGI